MLARDAYRNAVSGTPRTYGDARKQAARRIRGIAVPLCVLPMDTPMSKTQKDTAVEVTAAMEEINEVNCTLIDHSYHLGL
jgi:hypothetical protein